MSLRDDDVIIEIVKPEIKSDDSVFQELKVVDLPNSKGINEIDISSVIKIQNEDGTHDNYIPILSNGQIIMTPLMDVEELAPFKYVQKNNQVVRVVPIPNEPVTRKRTYQYRTRITPSNGRKLIIDKKTTISAKDFKQNFETCEELSRTMDLAPRTKKQMKDMVDNYLKLFAYPTHKMSSTCLNLYVRHCTSKKQPNFETFNDMELLPVGYKLFVDRPIKRITRPRLTNRYLPSQPPKDCSIQILLDAANVSTEESPKEEVIEYLTTEESSMELVEPLSEEKQLIVIDENGVEHQVVDASQDNFEALLKAAQSDEPHRSDDMNNDDTEYLILNENDMEVEIDDNCEYIIVS